jgi:hypothetical protein
MSSMNMCRSLPTYPMWDRQSLPAASLFILLRFIGEIVGFIPGRPAGSASPLYPHGVLESFHINET